MLTFQIILFGLIAVNFTGAESEDSATVRQTQYGYVRGEIRHSRRNSSVAYYAFQGVQFAHPPLEKYRFQEAEPPKRWSGVRDATRHRQICLQFDDGFTSTNVVGSEDCLYLDVYIPITARQRRMPVMVSFHGGNWVSLSTNDTAPDYMMEQPVVIVEVEYRLNVFGCLTTLDDYAKGNLGLKDQVMALKWIQRNIHYFDGDSSRVTIFGVSAGGATVFYHMVSPLSRGLFTQGISESGSPLNTWAVQRRPLDKTYRLARHFGIYTKDSKKIVKGLQKIDAETLFRAAFNFSIVGYFTPFDPQPFSTIIERRSKTAFLSESAYDRLRRGAFYKVPLIMGINTEEASYAWGTVLEGRIDISLYQREPQRLIPETMNIPPKHPCVNTTLDRITERYFPDGNYTNPIEWTTYLAQKLFISGILETGSYLYDYMPVYFYQFSYVGSRTLGYFGGTGHMEELLYLWYPQGYMANPNETESDILMSNRLIKLWTNFAAKGNPTPRLDESLDNAIWPTVDSNTQDFFNIGTNLTVQNPIPYRSDMEFWRQLYDECGFPDPNPNKRAELDEQC